jgi:hypothetical protein
LINDARFLADYDYVDAPGIQGIFQRKDRLESTH